MAHEHSDDAVDFLGVCALERLAVFELVVVEDGIAEAVVVDGVVVDEYSSGLDAVLEYLHGGGEVAVGLLDTGQDVVGAGGGQHVNYLQAFPWVIADTQNADILVEVEHMVDDGAIVDDVALGERQIPFIRPHPVHALVRVSFQRTLGEKVGGVVMECLAAVVVHTHRDGAKVIALGQVDGHHGVRASLDALYRHGAGDTAGQCAADP